MMAPCALRPDIPPADSGNVLFGAGAVGGEGNVQHSSQVHGCFGRNPHDVNKVMSRLVTFTPCCVQDCWATCKSDPRCASWWWCDERDGCTDEDGRRLPHKGCELRRETVMRRLGQPPRDWHLPTFAVGFMQREARPQAPRLQLIRLGKERIGNWNLAEVNRGNLSCQMTCHRCKANVMTRARPRCLAQDHTIQRLSLLTASAAKVLRSGGAAAPDWRVHGQREGLEGGQPGARRVDRDDVHPP